MNIAKALKVKNRLIHKINTKLTKINQENSFVVEHITCSAEDKHDTVTKLYTEVFDVLKPKLQRIKVEIQKANLGIADQLVEIQEKKAQLAFLKGLPIKEGKELLSEYRDNSPLVTRISVFTENDKDQKIAECQQRIEDLQDEIDAYNAATTINFKE